MKKIKSSSILCSKTRTGKNKYWQCHILSQDSKFYTNTSYWQVNKEGEKSLVQFSEPYECLPTNLGRANERNSEQQAEFEFDSIIKKQQDKGYIEEGGKSTILPLPMLANKVADKGHMIKWPAYVQAKYNGQRMLFDGVKGWSRGGKYIIPEVIQHLTFGTGGVILDGELMLEGAETLLQKIMTATKKYSPDLSPTLLYYVYDLIDSDKTFSERFQILQKLTKSFPANIILVPTYKVNNMGEVMTYHKQFTEIDKNEGTMIRSDISGYEIGYRSSSLLKLKDFITSEFIIKDVISGEGSFKNCGIFICKTKEGKEFNCLSEGTMEHRKEIFINKEKFINKWLEIRYQNLSKDGIPIFPIGIIDREIGEF